MDSSLVTGSAALVSGALGGAISAVGGADVATNGRSSLLRLDPFATLEMQWTMLFDALERHCVIGKEERGKCDPENFFSRFQFLLPLPNSSRPEEKPLPVGSSSSRFNTGRRCAIWIRPDTTLCDFVNLYGPNRQVYGMEAAPLRILLFADMSSRVRREKYE